jgi:hypothetical protein
VFSLLTPVWSYWCPVIPPWHLALQTSWDFLDWITRDELSSMQNSCRSPIQRTISPACNVTIASS